MEENCQLSKGQSTANLSMTEGCLERKGYLNQREIIVLLIAR